MDIRIGKSIVSLAGESTIHFLPQDYIDPYDQTSIDTAFLVPQSLPSLLRAGMAALLSSAEEISIPVGFVGLMGVRSTWARLGIVSPLTIVDPGFKGVLTLEIFNAGRKRILIRPGDAIWNLTLVSAPSEWPYTGRYQGQQGITLPKALA